MLHSIVVGLLMTIVTIAIHAVGTTAWARYLRKVGDRMGADVPSSVNLKVLCATAVVLLCLHIVEVIAWAFVYVLLVDSKSLANMEEALYFSTVTFASLGYGDVVIDGSWRLLSAIQSMIGLLAFGWSSALLYAVVQRILQSDHSRTASSD